jgi:Zn-dependent M28 family amino/carboxypeptidase
MIVDRARTIGLTVAVVLAACSDASGPEGAAEPAAIAVSPAALRSTVATLADDSMCGRLAGSPYEREAADYIASRFSQAGLEAGGVDGWFQDVPGPLVETPAPPTAQCIVEEPGLSHNVIGLLPGSGYLQGQWVLLGAHYDHLGWVDVGGRADVFNGADDNASGTAVVLEVAGLLRRWVVAHPEATQARRSIVFVTFGAEEEGLIGSQTFAFRPTVPGDSLYAVMNLDMVGRLRGGQLTIAGVDTWPAWRDLLDARRPASVNFVFDDGSLSRGDQFSFIALHELPAIHVFTGLHSEYHTTLDDPPTLNYEGMGQVAEMVLALVWDLATRTGSP